MNIPKMLKVAIGIILISNLVWFAGGNLKNKVEEEFFTPNEPVTEYTVNDETETTGIEESPMDNVETAPDEPFVPTYYSLTGIQML